MGQADHVVLERTGDIVARHPGDIALPVPSYDGRSIVPPAPPTSAEQEAAKEALPVKTLEELDAELAQARADLAAMVAAQAKG